MLDFNPLYHDICDSALAPWTQSLPALLHARLQQSTNSDLPLWLDTLALLPKLRARAVDFQSDTVLIGHAEECNDDQRDCLAKQLQTLHPWRKGPFDVFGVHIDTEWRSDFKWKRLQTALEPLKGRTVLDVGCGSGYHCWRMLGAGAKCVIGIEPMLRFNMQFAAIKKFIGERPVHVLPLALNALPSFIPAFDSVFSMGVLYHRKSPIDHLLDLRACLRQGGQLILETLVIDTMDATVLVPRKRYAKMPNVWFIPSCTMLQLWLRRTGFTNINVVDVNRTTTDEQRTTPWMRYESLADFLDPNDTTRTIEGYQAPVRAILTANAPA